MTPPPAPLSSKPDLPIPCLLRPCSGPLFFPSASALAQHYRSAHRPLTSIPSSALVPYLFRCKLCRDAIYSNPASLAKHARNCAHAPSPAPLPAATATDPTDAHVTTDFTTATAPDPTAHDAPPSHALTANLPFLASI
jgi:hypothetical protein